MVSEGSPTSKGIQPEQAVSAQATLQHNPGVVEGDLSCPVCMSTLKDPFVTNCGHTFCYACVNQHLQHKKNCPCCFTYLTRDHIHPNFLLQKLIQKALQARHEEQLDPTQALIQVVEDEVPGLRLPDVNKLLQLLWERKQGLEQQEAEDNLELLLRFLQHSRQEKADKLQELQAELKLLETDIQHVASQQHIPDVEVPAAHTQHYSQLHDILLPQVPSVLETQVPAPVGTTTEHQADLTHAHSGVPVPPQHQQTHVGMSRSPFQQHQLPPLGALHTPFQHHQQPHAGVSHTQQQQPRIGISHSPFQQQLHTSQHSEPQQQHQQPNNGLQPHTQQPQLQGQASGFVQSESQALPQDPQDVHGTSRRNLFAGGLVPGIQMCNASLQNSSRPGLVPVSEEMSRGDSAWPVAEVSQQMQAEQLPNGLQHASSPSLPTEASDPAVHSEQHIGAAHDGMSSHDLAHSSGLGNGLLSGTTIRSMTGSDIPEPIGGSANPVNPATRASADLRSASGLLGARLGSEALDLDGADGGLHEVVPPLPIQVSPQSAVMHPRHIQFQHYHQQLQQQQAARERQAQLRQRPASSSGTGATGTATISGASQSGVTVGSDPSSGPSPTAIPADASAARAKKRRVLSQFEDLQNCYLRLRKQSQQQEQQQHSTAEAQDAKRIKIEHTPHDSSNNTAAGHATGSGMADACAPAQPTADQLMATAAAASRDSAATDAATATGQLEKAAARASNGQNGHVGAVDAGLAEFSRMLSVLTNCSRLKVIAQLPRASTRQSSSILSSIEFDRDSQVFATAGVGKRISMYEYANLLKNPNSEAHCPSAEVLLRSKLSCLSWNRYVKSYLASSDYEGVVNVWDMNTTQSVIEIEGHEKRIWSVDFCHADPMLLVSGSDDGYVKVWSIKQQTPVTEIDMKANVCCVKYNPDTAHEVVVGSADHNVHLYDLRRTKQPLHVFHGHRKAVSYVRYMSGTELVSASTDSTLRMWSGSSESAVRVFNGHHNEKNFVGLAVEGEFIACGSETNELYVYYKAMSKPIARRLFSVPAEQQHQTQPDPSQFISAVCWKPQSQTLLAANSQGTIKVMQLTS